MPIYAYKCELCDNEFSTYRDVDDRAFAECPECKSQAPKDFNGSLPTSKGVVLNNELTTDFDGKGEKTYTRAQYKDKCKELGRDPVGLLWN